MHATPGRTATRLHLLLVLAVAVVGVGVLVVIGGVMVGGSAYSRDLALLAVILASPLWLLGLLAAIELLSFVRGRRLTRLRALVWALAAVVGGVVLAVAGGQMGLITTLVTRPDLIGFDWPTIYVLTADGSGVQFHYADQPGFWLPIPALGLGLASLLSLAIDRDWRSRSQGSTSESV